MTDPFSGQTTAFQMVTDRDLDKAAAGPQYVYRFGKGVVTWRANVLSAGRLVPWFLSTFRSAAQAETLTSINKEFNYYVSLAAAPPAGSDCLVVLPHWLRRRTRNSDANMRGAILG